MALKDTLRKGKLAITGLALGGALLTTGCSKNNPEETKDTKARQEQRVEGKSEIRQKIAYLDEYVAAVESGKDKEQAYQEFALKMADGNAKKMAEMQKQVMALQQGMKEHKQMTKLGTFVNSFVLTIICLGYGCLMVNKELNEHSKRITALEKSQKGKEY